MEKIPTRAHVRRNELFEDIAENLANQLIKKYEVPDAKAVDIGNCLADFLADRWKGQSIYIPSDWHCKNIKRDQEIYESMAFGNANEIAAKYGISAVRVYQIYNRCRVEKRQKYQIEAIKS